jgi:murein DD-endopeptidase MepM/ murein hydrolase activator NlpD
VAYQVNLQTVKVRDASNKDLLVFDIVKSAIQQKNIKRYFSQRRYQRAFEELYAEGELPAFGVLKTWGWAKEAIGSPVETLSRTMIGDDATDALLLMKRMNDFGEVVSDPLGAVEDQVGSWTTDASVANKLASKYLDVVLDLGTTVVSGYHDIWVNAQIGQYVDYRRGNNVDAGYELYRYLSGSGPLPTHDWELLAGDVKWFASSVPDDEDPPPQFWRMVEGLYQESVKQDDLDGLKKVLDAALPISKGQDVEADGPHRIDVSVFVENHNVLYGDPAEVCGGEKYDVELRLGAQGFRFLDDKLDPQNVNLSYEFEDVSADKSFYKSAEACALSERNSRATCLIPDVEIPEVTTSRRLPVDFRTSYRADYVSAHGNKYSVNKILEETHLPDFVIRPTGQLTYYVEGFEVGRRIGHDNTVYHDFGGDLEFGLGDKPLTAVDGISADLLVNGKRYELDVSPSGRFSESVVADEVHSAQLELSVPRYQGASCYRLSEEDKTVDLSVAELLAEQESEETTEGTKLGLYFTNSALSHHDDARRTVASGDMVNFWFPLSGEDSVEEAEDAYELYFDSDPYGGLTRLHPNAKFTEDSNGNVGVAFSYQYSQADYYRARVRPKKNGKFILVDGQPTTYYSPILVVESQTTINQAPTARAVVVGGQSQFSAGETFTLSAEGSTDPENDHLEYTWYYLADDRAAWLGRGVEFTHRTQVVGEHRFRVKAVDSNGNADFAEITLVVVESENSPPIAKINAPTSVEEDQGFAITTDGSSDSDGCIVGYHVTWGDGGESRLPPTDTCISDGFSWSHEYKAAGVYTIRLTATDDDGATDTAAATITVTETDDPEQVSVTSVSPTSAAAGQVVKYHVNGTNFPETVTAHIQNASYCGNKQRVSSELFTMDCMHRRTGSLEMTVKAQSGGELLAGGSVNIGFTPSQAEGFHYPVGLDEQTGERADFSGSQPVALAEQISPEQNNLYGANDVADNAKRGKPNSDNNLWRNAQDVGSFLELPGTEGVHPGEDWNQGSGDSDAGQPVTAIANGKVVRLANKGNLAWLMVLEHPQVGGDSVYSFYLHITGKQLTDGQMTSSVSSFGLQVGDWVSEKEVIGRLANMRGQNGSGLYAHLHFEIRTKYDPDLGDDWPGDNGNGYYTDGTIVVKKSSMTGDEIKRAHEVMSAVGFVDPSDFIDARRTPEASVAAIIADLQPREVVVDEQVTLTVTGSNIQQVSDVQPSAGNCSAARQTGFNEFELTCVFDNVGQTPVRVVVEGNDGKFVERSFDVAVNEADPVEGFSRDELRNRTLYRVYKENNRDWHLDRIIFGDDHYHYAPGITGPASFGPESYDIARDGSLVLVNATPGNPDGYTDVNVYPVKRADSYIEVCWDYGSDALFCALIYEDNGGDQGTERLYASSDAAKAFCEAQGGCVGADADEAGNLENGEATLRWQYNVDNETLDIDLLSTSFRNCGPNSVSESDALVLVTELSNTRMHWRHADGGIDQWSGSGTSSVNPAGTWYQSLADGSEYSLALSDNGSGSKPNGTGTLSGKCLPSNESGNREVDGLVQGLITAVTGSIATDLRIRLVTRDNVLQDSFSGLNCPISSSSGRFSDACLLGTNEEEFSASSGHHYQVVVYRDGNGDGRWNRGEETADCELQASTSGLDDYHQYGAWEQVDCYFDGRPEGGSDSGAGSGDPSGKRVTQGGINSPQPFSVGNTSCKAGVSQDVLSVVSDFQKYANAYARIGNDTTVIFNLDYPANSANSGASVQLGIVGNGTTDILYRTNYSSLSPSGGIKLARDVSAPYVGRYDLAVAVAEANDEDSGCVLRSTGYIEVVE